MQLPFVAITAIQNYPLKGGGLLDNDVINSKGQKHVNMFALCFIFRLKRKAIKSE